MKNMKKIIGLAVSSAMLLCALPLNAAAEEDKVFVTMNIPYNTFYQSDIKNEVEVDAVSSATDSKWKSFEGTYFVSNNEGVGGKILGVSFPVEISRADYGKLKAVEDETADYYFTDLEETPSVYKTLTLDNNGEYVFSEVQGTVTEIADTKYELETETVWGDYLFEFSDVEINGTVYGIIVTADDGTQYGLRHLENIWKKNYEFAWGSGIKETDAKGNVLSSAHYESMMGTNINDVKYITDTGIYSYPVDQYVAIKTKTVITVDAARADANSTNVSFNPELPEDYKAAYSAKGLDTQYDNGTLSYTNAKAGSYTLTVSDINGKYADILSSFIVSTDKLPVAYDNDSKQIVAVAGFEDNLSTYLNNITNVKVDGTDYIASGKHGIKIINTDDGKIDMEAAGREGSVFDTQNKDTFNLTVSAAGYPELSFVISTKEKNSDTSSDNSSSDTSSDTSTDKSSDTSSNGSTDKSSDTSANTSSGNTSGNSSNTSFNNASNGSNVSSPKTSDSSNVFAYLITAVIAFIVTAGLLSIKSKKVNDR